MCSKTHPSLTGQTVAQIESLKKISCFPHMLSKCQQHPEKKYNAQCKARLAGTQH
jgi:hypothetical protein